MNLFLWILIIIIIIGIIYTLSRKKEEDSFLSRSVRNAGNGCAKLLDKIRGC